MGLQPRRRWIDPAHILLILFLGILLIAGGASRADVIGQPIVRAWAVLTIMVLIASRGTFSTFGTKWVGGLLVYAAVIVALQLLPLPPSLWLALPGRDLFAEITKVIGYPLGWRPLSMSPSFTINALGSLLIPFAVLLVVSQVGDEGRRRTAATIVALVGISACLALVEASGGKFDNPFVNDQANDVSAFFANRNHLALFLAMGLILIPVWLVRGAGRMSWRTVLCLLAMAFISLMIIATGSRSGLVLIPIAIMCGLGAVASDLRGELAAIPRRWRVALIAGIVVAVFAVLTVAIFFGRATAVDRLLASDQIADKRLDALPVIWSAIRFYFPFGSGAGAFDPVYRIVEPIDRLDFGYLNHAHNDWIEVLLDTGVFGLLGLALVVAAWGFLSLRAWGKTAGSQRNGSRDRRYARAGSGLLLLVFVASVTDYPARTPLIMAMMVIAGFWLSNVMSGMPKPGANHRDVDATGFVLARKTRVILVALTAVVGLAAVGSSAGWAIAKTNPALAYRLAPHNGHIAAKAAQNTMTLGIEPSDRVRAVAMAKRALLDDGTAADALNVIGLDAQLSEDVATARAAFLLSLRMTRRELQARLWSIEDAVARGDIEGALKNYDWALRSSREANGVLFPVLASSLSEPLVRRHLVRLLRTEPPWRLDFINSASLQADPAALDAFVKEARVAGIPISPEAYTNIVNQLASASDWNAAWAVYASVRPGSAKDRSRDPAFKGGPSYNSFFDWSAVSQKGLSATILPSGDESGFEVIADPGATGVVLTQTEVFSPGTYRMASSGEAFVPVRLGQLYWRLTCNDGRELGRVTFDQSGTGNIRSAGEITVPVGCPVQTLTLVVAPVLTDGGLQIRLASASLAKVR